ncbi:hypothetical protein IWQ55_000282 [Labrenzia sp. EL_208]|nr:hypothetical protein [Labrenzia sp. EL_132]MBG6227090.1 hypothetical protein [Labrenzia sp. EL_208]
MKMHKHTEKMFRAFVKDGNTEAALRVWTGAYRASLSQRSDDFLRSLFVDVMGKTYSEYLADGR